MVCFTGDRIAGGSDVVVVVKTSVVCFTGDKIAGGSDVVVVVKT